MGSLAAAPIPFQTVLTNQNAVFLGVGEAWGLAGARVSRYKSNFGIASWGWSAGPRGAFLDKHGGELFFIQYPEGIGRSLDFTQNAQITQIPLRCA